MLSKLHSECEALFQTPLINFGKSGTCWYKNEPLGKNTIAQLMPKISKKAGLSLIYTAHCVRASTITSLHQAGVDAKQICAITKHKNEQSFQKRACSNILSRPFAANEAVGATGKDPNNACSSFIADREHRKVNVSFSSTSEARSVKAVTPNCQFSNCTINFNTYTVTIL